MSEEDYVILRGPSSSEGASDPLSLAKLEAHVRALPPFEDATLAPSVVLRLIRYAALGQACEGNGLGWYAEDGTMRFQAPEDVIAECAVTAYISRQCGDA